MIILLIILFVALMLVAMFCVWVLARSSSIASIREEQMEIERMLLNEQRKSRKGKK